MGIVRQVKAVLWSFIGLGRRQDMAQLHDERTNPLLLILIAFVLVLLLLGTLAFVAHAVTAGAAAPTASATLSGVAPHPSPRR